MFRIMLKDMWVMAKKRLAVCAFYAVLVFGGAQMMRNFLTGFGMDMGALKGGEYGGIWRCLLSILMLVFIYMIVQEIPLRICRGMFICAAGKKERLRYLLWQLSVKMLLSLLFLTAVLAAATKGVFVDRDPWVRTAQILLTFFTLLNINLKIGIGIKGARKLDEKGFAIYSPSEVAVNTNWFCFILIQNVLFYTCILIGFVPEKELTVGFIVLMLALNLYYMIRYLVPVLGDAMSYENVYRQEPVKEYAQSDITGGVTYTIFRI